MFSIKRKNIFIVVLSLIFLSISISCFSKESYRSGINGFTSWFTGYDPKTIQIIPTTGNDALTKIDLVMVAHVKFNVAQYGEMSFPIDSNSLPNQEALKVDLSKSTFVKLTYKANQSVVLQLRQTGVHGGVQNHVVLSASKNWVTRKIYFSEFSGGLTPLDLTNVAKFNFAMLSNNEKDGYAELSVRSFSIDHFQPSSIE